MKIPCKECPDRPTGRGCGRHGQCEKYLAFNKEREAIREAKRTEHMLDGYTTGEVAKAKRGSRRFRKR